MSTLVAEPPRVTKANDGARPGAKIGGTPLQRDLFGEVITERRKRPPLFPNGYAAPPGTGTGTGTGDPGAGAEGETCRTCRHYARVRFAKIYRKCALMRAHWTHGPGTDIKAGSPACAKWEA